VAINGIELPPNLWFMRLMIWGDFPYPICGRYRVTPGGGPGLETPPEQLESNSLYAYTGNPMNWGRLFCSSAPL